MDDGGHPGRRRGTRACINCRLQKARCSGETPQCNNCQRRHLECHYPALRRARQFYQGRDGKLAVTSPNCLVSLTELQQGLYGSPYDRVIVDRAADFYQSLPCKG